MPRKSKGPRLYLRGRDGRPRVWVILDGSTEVSTGCGELDRTNAEKYLSDYLTKKHKPDWHQGNPSEVSIADVLFLYGSERAPKLAHPELVGFHMEHLLSFFGDKVCSDIDAKLCNSYCAARLAGKGGRRAVKIGTARRELETLSAALSFALRNKKLMAPVFITLPEKPPARERWLSRSEAASLLAGSLGIVPIACDVATRRPVKWGRMFKPSYHVARFILIALYTGTRHDAVLRLGWSANTNGGWVDLERQIIYRRGVGQVETNKRRTPAPIPENLLPHFLRWRRITTVGPVEYAGRLIAKERRGFDRACDLAGLGEDVTPHVLKHTCATWMLQRGVGTWEVAGFLGTSEKVIQSTYGHHSPNHLPNAKKRFRGQSLGQ